MSPRITRGKDNLLRPRQLPGSEPCSIYAQRHIDGSEIGSDSHARQDRSLTCRRYFEWLERTGFSFCRTALFVLPCEFLALSQNS